VVRWPAPILVASPFVVLIGVVLIWDTSRRTTTVLPTNAPVNAASPADRHFTQARMNPDILMTEADHDMRNPGDMLV
jgi:RND superfamily putative drug exporter